MFVLNGFCRKEGDMEQNFSSGETELALHVAKIWQKLGWQPRLKHYDGSGVHFVNFNPPLRKAA
jgi:hypothetical protein